MKLLKAILLVLVLAGPSWGLDLTALRTETRRLAIDSGTRLRFSTSTIDGYLNEAQRIAVIHTKALRKSTMFDLAGGTTYYQTPSDFLQIKELTSDFLYLYAASPAFLYNKRGRTWRESTGEPTHYFMELSSRTMLGFYPFPGTGASTTTIRYVYYAQATDLSATTDEPFDSEADLVPYHYLLAFYAAFRMVAIDGRTDLAALYRAEFYEGLARMKTEANLIPAYKPGLYPSDGRSRVGP